MKKLLLLILIAAASCAAPEIKQERVIEGPFLILSTPYYEDGSVNYDNLVVKGKVDFPQIGFEKGTTERGFSKVSKSV